MDSETYNGESETTPLSPQAETPSWWKTSTPMQKAIWAFVLLCGFFCLLTSVFLWTMPSWVTPLMSKVDSVVDDRTDDKFTSLTNSLANDTKWINFPIASVDVRLSSDGTTAVTGFAPTTSRDSSMKYRVVGSMVELSYIVNITKAYVSTTYGGLAVFVTLPKPIAGEVANIPIASSVDVVVLGDSLGTAIMATKKVVAITGSPGTGADAKKIDKVRFDVTFDQASTVTSMVFTGSMLYTMAL